MPSNFPERFDFEVRLHPLDVRVCVQTQLDELITAVVQDPAQKTTRMRRLSRSLRRLTQPIPVRGARQGADAIASSFMRENGIAAFNIVTVDTFAGIVAAATAGSAQVYYEPGARRATVQWTSALMDVALSDAQSYRQISVCQELGVHYIDRAYVGAVLDELYALWGRRMTHVREYRRRNGLVRAEEERKSNVRSGGGDFSAFWRQRQDSPIHMAAGEGNLQEIEILPHGTLSSRNWGIEIEAVDIEGISTPSSGHPRGRGGPQAEA